MTQHYFSETPTGDFAPREIEVELAGAPRRLLTAGGVFSPEHLDQGTGLLIRTLAASADGTEPGSPILDLGCGWGPIALDAALRHPDAEVWAIDVNARARELTTANAARLGLANVRVAAPDEPPAELRFASIRSNPPIRVGKEVPARDAARVAPRLAPAGTAHLVVAKHLGAESLQRWIAAEFPELAVARIARDRGFHVLEAQRREPPDPVR